MICRLCIKDLSVEESISLFSTEENASETFYVQLINKHFMLQIYPDDAVSTSICKDCSTHLEDIHNFCCYVQQQQDNLNNQLPLFAECIELISDDEEEEQKKQLHFLEAESTTKTITHSNNVQQQNSLAEFSQVESLDSIPNYVNADANPMYYNCCLCDYSSDIYMELSWHFREKHQLEPYIYCCGKKLLLPDSIRRHVEMHQKIKLLVCKLCNKELTSMNDCNSHHCQVTSMLLNVNECALPSKKCFDSSLLTEHPEKYTKCSKCYQKFLNKEQLQQHLLLDHDINKPLYKCLKCKKTFISMQGLKSHSIKHKQEVCKICLQTVPSKEVLERHINSFHIGPNAQFRCFRCFKSFKSQSEIEQHIVEHKSSRRFVCCICQREFGENASLRRHLRIKHTEEYYQLRKEIT